jgi:hypothetical protein
MSRHGFAGVLISLSVVTAAGGAQAAILWSSDQPGAFGTWAGPWATSPKAVFNTQTPPVPCRASEGCFAKPNLLDEGPTSGNLPDRFSFNYFLTQTQHTTLVSSPGTARLSVTAARDVGHKPGAPAEDVLNASLNGVAVGGLFGSIIDNCPSGERGATPQYPTNLNCGPNYHTDFMATDTLAIPGAIFQEAATVGAFTLELDPTAAVGRLKLFRILLEYEGTASQQGLGFPQSLAVAQELGDPAQPLTGQPVSEPTSLALIVVGAAGLIGLAVRRRSGAVPNDRTVPVPSAEISPPD